MSLVGRVSADPAVRAPTISFVVDGQDSGQFAERLYQRQIACVPAAGGRATCDTLQPETKGAATVGFERAPPKDP